VASWGFLTSHARVARWRTRGAFAPRAAGRRSWSAASGRWTCALSPASSQRRRACLGCTRGWSCSAHPSGSGV